MRVLITGTGAGVGKTWVGQALALALRSAGKRVVAIKPVETGCFGPPGDRSGITIDFDGLVLKCAERQQGVIDGSEPVPRRRTSRPELTPPRLPRLSGLDRVVAGPRTALPGSERGDENGGGLARSDRGSRLNQGLFSTSCSRCQHPSPHDRSTP